MDFGRGIHKVFLHWLPILTILLTCVACAAKATRSGDL